MVSQVGDSHWPSSVDVASLPVGASGAVTVVGGWWLVRGLKPNPRQAPPRPPSDYSPAPPSAHAHAATTAATSVLHFIPSASRAIPSASSSSSTPSFGSTALVPLAPARPPPATPLYVCICTESLVLGFERFC